MVTSVIALKVAISRQGQQNYFQVNVPKDTARIIGIETGITGLDGVTPPEITGRQLAGQIRLQAENAANICYSAPVYLGISDLDKQLLGFDPLYTGWQQNLHIGCIDKVPDPVTIQNSYMLYGNYTDAFGKKLNRDLRYTVGLYLWTEMF